MRSGVGQVCDGVGVTQVRHVAVVGGGIAGLAAAAALRADPAVRIMVLEASGRIGGKLAVSEVAGLSVDEGAESMLTRRPEAVELAGSVGLGDSLIVPMTATAALWSRGRLHPLPDRTVMGVPSESTSPRLRRVLTIAERARLRLDRVVPGRPLGADEDVAVGALVERRLGPAVVDRIVEPLLGGVYAGSARQLSLAMTVPALLGPARRHRSLLAAAAEALTTPGSSGPVFAGIAGGVGRLPGAVARASGAQIRTRTTVRSLERTATGWRLLCGPLPAPEVVEADVVVLAVPATPAARLLRPLAPWAAAELEGLSYASVGLVTLVLRDRDLRRPLRGSGLLVPPVEGLAVKAVTHASVKWGWIDQAARPRGLAVLRASVGRHGETAVLQREDADLVTLVRADLATLLGTDAKPVAARVTRWGGSLPQYAPGHLDLVARVRAAVAALPGLAVCGAAYDGVGIPACIASGRAAAAAVLVGG